jgi:hypothetical protein
MRGHQRRHLFGPHAGVGRERVREGDDRAVFRADEVIGDIAANERE